MEVKDPLSAQDLRFERNRANGKLGHGIAARCYVLVAPRGIAGFRAHRAVELVTAGFQYEEVP